MHVHMSDLGRNQGRHGGHAQNLRHLAEQIKPSPLINLIIDQVFDFIHSLQQHLILFFLADRVGCVCQRFLDTLDF